MVILVNVLREGGGQKVRGLVGHGLEQGQARGLWSGIV